MTGWHGRCHYALGIMIRPVQPVGWHFSTCALPAISAALFRRLEWLRWVNARPLWSYAPYPAAPEGSRCLEPAELRMCPWPAALKLHPADAWEPWPAYPPYADRVSRWWPFLESPPAGPPIVIEDGLPDAPVQIVDWRSIGALIDLWA
jgi:hypothetical protein